MQAYHIVVQEDYRIGDEYKLRDELFVADSLFSFFPVLIE